MNRWLCRSLWMFLTLSLAGCGNMAGQAPPTPAASDVKSTVSPGADPAAKNTVNATPFEKNRPGSAIAEEDLGSLSPNGDTTVESADEPAAP